MNVLVVVHEPPAFAKVVVTTILATIGKLPKLLAVNGGIEPDPFAVKPIVVFEFVHEYEVVPPVLVVVKLIPATASPLQTTCETGEST